jgi:hypothetical protein
MHKICLWFYIYFLAVSITLVVFFISEKSFLAVAVNFFNVVVFYLLIQSAFIKEQRQEHLSRLIQEYGHLISPSEQAALIKGKLSCAELQERLSIRQIQKPPFEITAPEILIYHHCFFASHSPFLRCAVNPDGPCNTCQSFQSKVD